MPPRGSQKTGPKSSQQNSTLTTAFKKLCDHLRKARKTDGEIKAPDAVNTLKESLRTHRTKATHIEPKFVIDLVSNLEKEGINICSRLDESTFSVIVETILQSDYCVESERGLFLLSGSLHNYRGPTVNGKTIEKRKELVGKKCFELLLTYFIETSHSSNLRRRVGILCIELLQGSEENVQRLQLMPEGLRGGIGGAMVKEENEIVRSICGRLVRITEAAGLPVDSLWPINYDKHLYEGFPSTKRHISWSQQYIDYVDKLIQNAKPAFSNVLYLHYAKGCELTPSHRFGDSNSKINIFLNDGQITFLATSSGSTTDQILDIPWVALLQMNIIFQTESQIEGTAEVIITLRNDDNIFCILDGEGTKLESVFFSSDIEQIQSLQQELRAYCPDLEMVEEYPDVKRGSDERNEVSQRSYTSAVAIQLNEEEPPSIGDRAEGSQRSVVSAGAVETVEKPMSQHIRQTVFGAQVIDSMAGERAEPVPESHQLLDEGQGSEATVPDYQNVEDDLYNASPPRQSAQRAKEDDVDQRNEEDPDSREENLASINHSKLPSKKRKSVKPVAKAPIRLTQKPQNAQESGKEKIPMSAKQNPQPNKDTAKKGQADARSKGVKDAALKAKEPEAFDSEALTSPDANDTSTPKVTKSVENDDRDYIPPKNPVETAAHESQPRRQKPGATSLNIPQAKNRNAQSLSIDSRQKPNALDSANARDVFELPDDDEEEESQNAKRKGKVPQKATSKSQSKKTAPKSKAETRKRESAPPAVETMPPPKAKPVKKRESAPSVIESMLPLKNIPNSKKRQSAPPAIETMPPPPLPQRITRSNKNATSLADEAESQSQASKAKSSSKTSITEPAPVPRPVKVQDDIIALMDDDSIDRFPVSENEVVKDTPVKVNDKPKASQKITNDHVSFKSVKNPLIKMASKMNDLLDFTDRNDEMGNGSANDSSIQDISHSKKKTVEHDERMEEDELACASNVNPTQTIKVSTRVDDDSKVFKIPDIPEHSSKTRNSRGSKAIESKSTKRLDVTPIPRDSTSPTEQSGASNESRKRKAMTEDTTPSKRSRPSENKMQASESPSPRRSPRIASKLKKRSKAPEPEVQSPIPTRTVKERKLEDLSMPPPKQVVSHNLNETQKLPNITPAGRAIRVSQRSTKALSRPTPRTGEGAAETPAVAAAPSTTDSKTPLVDDRLARKPGVISFNKHGALNQGVSSTPRLFAEPAIPKSLTSKEPSDRKRKHDETDFVRPQSPPKKRKSVSPPEVNVDENYEEYEEADQPDIGSSPPQPLPNPAKLTIANQPLQLRPGSQGSRVDPNGSPHPSPMSQEVDHFSRMERKLNEESQALEKQEHMEEQKVRARPRRVADVFGPKVKLSSQAKEAPTSLDKSEPRYVAVKKTQNGHYEEVYSKEVILPQKVLPDPFVEKNSRVSSGFTERLQIEAKTREKTQNSQQQGAARQSLVDPEKTLVNAERRPWVKQRVPSLSTGTSVDSRSSEPSRSPLQDMDPAEMWNVAVRPHYSTLRQAVHRVADEVIIRLADEEDKMDLLVEEYKENGAKVLDNIAQKRAEEKTKMLESLEEKKNTMIIVYAATRKSISSTVGKLKQRSVGPLAKDWQTEQDFIREKVGQGVEAD